jgi:spore coat protein A
MAPSRAVRTRILTLDEYFDSRGRVVRSLLNGTRWSAPVTERPRLGTTEIWALVNLTQDAHPVHLHGVRFQVLDRRAIDVAAFQKNRSLVYTGTAKEPSAGESGWKDTVRADPGAVTRIIVPFESFAGLYSWHCHILEHEDNEMMRPFEIVAADQTGNR